jgi:hypothetical protein
LLIRVTSSNLGSPETTLAVKDSILFESADAWKARSKQACKSPYEEVFFMQKEWDFSLIGYSHWLGTEDAVTFIEKQTKKYSSKMLGVNLHPFSGLSREALRRIDALPNSAIFRLSAYEIMSCNNLSAVFSISSSVLEEARYFQKKSVGLLCADSDESASDLTTASLTKVFLSLGLQTSVQASALDRNLGFDWILGPKPSLPKFESN